MCLRKGLLLLTLEAADRNVIPTAFQRSSFPACWQERISVILEGIDTHRARPHPAVVPLTLPDGTVLRRGEPIATLVNRRLEPDRGCYIFLRVRRSCSGSGPMPGGDPGRDPWRERWGPLSGGGLAPAPVWEVIRDRENVRLVDLFDPGALAATVAELLGDPE